MRVTVTDGVREMAGVVLAAGAGLGVLWTADRATPRGTVHAGSLLGGTVLHEFGGYRAESGRRGANENSRIEVRGLWGSAPVAVSLDVASPAQPRRVRIFANGRPVLEPRIGASAETVSVEALADPRGSLSLRFTGVRTEGTALQLASVRVTQRSGGVTGFRLLVYALFGAGAWILARTAARPPPIAGAAVAGLLCVAAAAIHFARLETLATFPRIALAVALTAAWSVLSAALARVGLPASAGRWVAAAAAFQLVLAATPRFGMIDTPWHTRNLWTFLSNGLTVSTAPGLDAVAYPPAFYAALAPLARGAPSDVYLVRIGLAAVQATSPLLVFALMRSAGATVHASAAATVMAAVMPEAVLVIAKGIACNVFGAFMGLVALIASLRRGAIPLLAGVLAVAFLSHAGVATSLILLLVTWWTAQRWRGDLDERRYVQQLCALASAARLAWLVYYREVPTVVAATGVPTNPHWGEVRWFRLGKIAQDLLLKFGLLPLFLAAAMIRGGAAEPLRTLLRCWFAVGVALALVAVLTPFPLRFEYFVLPAVAIAAGLGVERLPWNRPERARLWAAGAAAVFALQVALGVLLVRDRFEIITVIMESPRWPFPIKPAP
jgi:hypothetical protein